MSRDAAVSPVAATPPEPTPAASRRNVGAILAAQVLSATGVGMVITIATITGSQLSGSDVIAALAQTSTIVGLALATIPLTAVAATRGRRVALVGAFSVGALGCAVAALAVVLASWPLLFLGFAGSGAAMAAGFATRFAAADSARSASGIPRLIALVLWASTVGSILGPNLFGPFTTLAGSEHGGVLIVVLVAAALHAAAAVIVLAGFRDLAPRAPAHRRPRLREQLRAVAETPGAARGILVAATSQALMVGLMGLAPVQLHHGGVDAGLVGIAMSLHMAGMYVASPLVGMAVGRFGALPVAGCGALLFAVSCGILALAPHDNVTWFIVGLLGLGLAWSLGLIAASTMVTTAAAPEARITLQGASDFLMSVAGAAASALAGVITGLIGYSSLSWFGLGIVAIVTVVVVAGLRRAPTPFTEP